MRKIFWIASLTLMVTIGCNSSKKAAPADAKAPVEVISENQNNKLMMNDTMPPNKEETYRLIVSFISIGEGTDANAFSQMNAYVEEQNVATRSTIKYISVPWGREGEVDCLFRLSSLEQKQQEAFVAGLMSMYKENKLVQISESAKCPRIRN